MLAAGRELGVTGWGGVDGGDGMADWPDVTTLPGGEALPDVSDVLEVEEEKPEVEEVEGLRSVAGDDLVSVVCDVPCVPPGQ